VAFFTNGTQYNLHHNLRIKISSHISPSGEEEIAPEQWISMRIFDPLEVLILRS